MATVRWSPYASATTVLSVELSGLANNALSGASSMQQNSAGFLYCDLEFVAGAAFSPSSGAQIDIWLLRSVDGSTYEDGSNTVTPPRDADGSIAVRNGTSIIPRSGISRIRMPPGFYKALARNRTGAALPSGSIIRLAAYSEQAV